MTESINILIVDDDEVDAELMRRTLSKSEINPRLFFAYDGVHALEILRGTGGEPKLERPYLILLDLKMPRMNGIEFLEELRNDPELRRSVVFVITTSRDDQDRLAAYDRNIAGYVVKSSVGERSLDLTRLLEYYRNLVELP
ncbi:response regulator [Lignipirellula cremea]|uniref:Response regulator rcp1 n=1 Tax=Lignipirellula cremea TaxID=2528010 RepID=A0A518E2K4_9BACT|nr:response regulator [Lignipirellula cremea]QDU98321.1 Response regulator rcp1 [Lignipirellula cremea]